MDKLVDTKSVKIRILDNTHIGNHCIDTIPPKPRGFAERLGIFHKGEIDRSGLPNQRDGWYITAVYIANTETFSDFLELVRCAGEQEFCLGNACQASRKVRDGGFHELQVILLRHCEVSPSFLYAPSDGEKSWQVIQICRLLNLVKSFDTKARDPFALEMSGLIHYYRVRSSGIHGVSYYSHFYGMLDKDMSASENVSTETLFEICAIRDKITSGPNVYRAIAAVYAGSQNKMVNGFDGHKHLASPFLPTVHIEVLYEPSTKFPEGEVPNPHNTILALKEAALQFNKYGKVLEPAETYNISRDGGLDKLGIPNQEDLEDFAESGVWKDDWDLKTRDPDLCWPGKYPFELEPAPLWNWGALGKEIKKKESEKAESENRQSVGEDVPAPSLKVEHDSVRSVHILGSKVAFPSLRLIMRRSVRYWKEATEQQFKPMNSERETPADRRHASGTIDSAAINPDSPGTWRSLRKGIKGVFRRPPLPITLRPEPAAQIPAVEAMPRSESTADDIATSEAANAIAPGKTPDCGQWIFSVSPGGIRDAEFVPRPPPQQPPVVDRENQASSSLLKRVRRQLSRTLWLSEKEEGDGT